MRKLMLKKVPDKSGPEPPRNVPDEEGNLPDPARPEGAFLEPWPLDHVEVVGTPPKRQKLTPQRIERAVAEGWGKFDGETVTFLTKPKKLTYRVVAEAGRYCCHCGKKLPDDVQGTGWQARIHVAESHPGEDSPDPQNPAGYRGDNFLLCERVS